MVLINYATKEIVAKIVYYGPGLCGKTTNLQYIYTKLNPKKRGKMISLSTEADRTLFFDFLPMELGTVQSFKVRFQLYTVPGQVFYGATRKIVLKGADAVVFVADSQMDVLAKNIESIEDMKQNLIENSLDPSTIPLVFQYNKRDLDNIMDVETMEREMNFRGTPHFEAAAVDGTGVMETFKEITRMLLQNLKSKHSFMDTEKLRDFSPEVFESKKDSPMMVEEKPVEYELELGSAIRDDSTEEEVVAGELLEQMETISLADASQAEEFFDNVRKGAPAEEARQKAAKLGRETAEPRQAAKPAAAKKESYEAVPGSTFPVGERELTVDELDAAEIMVEPPAKELPRKPAPKKPAAKKPEAQAASANPEPATMYVPTPVPAPPPHVDLSPVLLAIERLGKPVDFSPVLLAIERLGKPADLSPVLLAIERLGKPQDLSPVLLAIEKLGKPQDLSPALQAIERLGKELSSLRDDLSDIKALIITSQTEAAPAPEGFLEMRQTQQPDIGPLLDELRKTFTATMEGQDRLMLSILETVRETKRGSSDAFEKVEDGLKYIIDRIREEDTGTSPKKKWF